MAEGNEHRQLAKGALINILGIAARSSKALALIIFSRFLGSERLGLYLLAFAIQEVVSKIAVLGLDYGIMRTSGLLAAQEREAEIRRSILVTAAIAFLSSTLVAAGLYFIAPTFSVAFLNNAALARPLQLFSFCIPLVSTTSIFVYAFRTTLRMQYEVYVRSVLEPAVLLVSGVGLINCGLGVNGAVLGHLAAAAASLALSIYYLQKLYPARGAKTRPLEWRTLWGAALPMGGMELLNNFKLRLDLLVLGYMMPLSTVGIFGAVCETAALLRKVRTAFDPIFMPMALNLHETQDASSMSKHLGLAIRWIMLSTLVMLGPMFFAPDLFMWFFGRSFLEGSSALGIAGLGQFFVVTIGLVESALAVTGFAHVTLINCIVLVLLNFELLVILIPPFGLVGAAAATTLSLLAVSLWRLWQMKRLTGQQPLRLTHLKPLPGWVAGLGLAYGALWGIPNYPVISYALAVLFFLVAFYGGYWMIGLEDDDRDVWQAIKQRLPFCNRAEKPC